MGVSERLSDEERKADPFGGVTDPDYELHGVHRRIRNILEIAPASSWDLDESVAVLNVLSAIVRARRRRHDEPPSACGGRC
jgi:hypothetical protein